MSASTVSEPKQDRLKDPDYFRSRLVEKLAEVERWAHGRLRAADRKPPHLLGLKLDAVRKMTESHPKLFKKAARTAELLDGLKPFQELRSKLVHSTFTTATCSGDRQFTFEEVTVEGSLCWRGRIMLKEDELPAIICQVSDLANQLRQQIPD